jgi:ABC-2 type transport system ATP-binding protein
MPVDQPNQDSIIVVDKLTKRYGDVAAVDNVSFTVKRGEIFGFLGPNGAGKTTTVRILTGVIEPDGGSALISGHRAGSLQAKQVAGVVPEMANAYADMSGWNNLMFTAELYGISSTEARKRSEGLLQELGLEQRKNDAVKTYSKGMRQRLILCMALVSDPAVLFLDEPTSGLDVQSARLMKNMLRGLNSGGKTIFLTTHDMDEANELCDRVAIINQGKIAAIERPEKLKMAAAAMHSVEVSFADAVSPEALANLPGVKKVDKAGDKYRLYTDAPGDVIVSLGNYSISASLKIVSLNTLYPSLEDAFVALTEKEAKHA